MSLTKFLVNVMNFWWDGCIPHTRKGIQSSGTHHHPPTRGWNCWLRETYCLGFGGWCLCDLHVTMQQLPPQLCGIL